MNLSNLEKETIILFNEAESDARIETFNDRLLKKLRSAVKKTGKVSCIEDKDGYGVYICPKKNDNCLSSSTVDPRTTSKKI